MLGASSEIGRGTDVVFAVIALACAVLFAAIVFSMVYFLFRYAKKRSPVPEDVEGNATLELSFLGGSVAIVLAMFFWGWDGYRALKGEAPEGALQVKATGQMWLWTFEYPNGRTANELTLPLKRPVKLLISSNDVIHSVYIPAFRVKQDAVPGAVKALWFVPDETGLFDLFCAEYCGTGHSAMLTRVRVVGAADFERWLAGAEAAAAPPASAAARGEALYRGKGCGACHSTDGSKGIGPTFKGIYGRKVRVVSDGKAREVLVDDDYIRRSELDPAAEVVEGFDPVMPSQKGILKDGEIGDLAEFIKGLR